jgi:hypothetical protein
VKLCGHRARRRALCVQHVPVELRRAAHRLAGVVDDEVEPLVRRPKMLAEALDARRVPQVEPEDLEAIAPVVEVALLGVPGCGVARERVVTIRWAPARSSLIPA